MNSSAESSANFDELKMVSNDNSDKSFKCNYCKKTFSCSSNLAKHHKMHNLSINLRMKSFKEVLCSSKGFSKNLKMNSLFECSFCKKLFAHKSNLIRHLRIHSREKPFECNLCGKSFASSSNLVRHVSTHAMQNPFKCGYCKKVFTKSNELTKHIQSHAETKSDCISLVSSSPSSSSSDGLSSFSSPINLVWTPSEQQSLNGSQERSSEISSHSTSENPATAASETEGKPDHTYCSGSNHQHPNSSSKENNLFPSKNIDSTVKSKNYLIESTDQPLAPDHTYPSTCDPTQNNGKKKTKTPREPKSVHSSSYKKVKLSAKTCVNVKSDFGFDHTYCTGGSNHKKCEMVSEKTNPAVDSNSHGTRKEDCLGLKNCGSNEKQTADHTYSSGRGNKSNVLSQKMESEAAPTLLSKPNQVTSTSGTDDPDLEPDYMDLNLDCLDPDDVDMEAGQDRVNPDRDHVNSQQADVNLGQDSVNPDPDHMDPDQDNGNLHQADVNSDQDCVNPDQDHVNPHQADVNPDRDHVNPDHANPDHIYCVDLDVQIISVGQEVASDADRGVELVSTAYRGQPDHTYCHGKNKTAPREGGKEGSKRNAKKEHSVCLNDRVETLSAAVRPSRDILDHNYCCGDKLVHNTVGDYDNDHTYCVDNDHLQDITCSDDWNSGMKFDHTYCLVQTVSRHF